MKNMKLFLAAMFLSLFAGFVGLGYAVYSMQVVSEVESKVEETKKLVEVMFDDLVIWEQCAVRCKDLDRTWMGFVEEEKGCVCYQPTLELDKPIE